MKHEVKIPNVGESITEVFIGTWQKKSGDIVKKDDILVDLETQKTSFELHAEVGGKLEIFYPEPETKVKPGDVIATIDDSQGPKAGAEAPPAQAEPKISKKERAEKSEEKLEKKPDEASTASSAAKRLAEEKGIDVASLIGDKGKRSAASAPPKAAPTGESAAPQFTIDESRGERREPTSRIRRTIAANLVKAQHTAAILTTFNEVDMSQVMDFRGKHKEKFKAKHGVSLGIVGFFARASIRALKELPILNASFTGEEIIRRDFVDLGVAVSTEAGLVVPVIRDSEKLSLVDFEKKLSDVSQKAQSRKLSIEEMSGGTFTISNGGVFGSLLSTPILNLPQSAILGLHKIEERPVVMKGEITIRPMMYLALSYDHRLIDGRDAVTFLVKIKEGIEDLYHIVSEADLD